MYILKNYWCGKKKINIGHPCGDTSSSSLFSNKSHVSVAVASAISKVMEDNTVVRREREKLIRRRFKGLRFEFFVVLDFAFGITSGFCIPRDDVYYTDSQMYLYLFSELVSIFTSALSLLSSGIQFGWPNMGGGCRRFGFDILVFLIIFIIVFGLVEAGWPNAASCLVGVFVLSGVLRGASLARWMVFTRVSITPWCQDGQVRRFLCKAEAGVHGGKQGVNGKEGG